MYVAPQGRTEPTNLTLQVCTESTLLLKWEQIPHSSLKPEPTQLLRWGSSSSSSVVENCPPVSKQLSAEPRWISEDVVMADGKNYLNVWNKDYYKFLILCKYLILWFSCFASNRENIKPQADFLFRFHLLKTAWKIRLRF